MLVVGEHDRVPRLTEELEQLPAGRRASAARAVATYRGHLLIAVSAAGQPQRSQCEGITSRPSRITWTTWQVGKARSDSRRRARSGGSWPPSGPCPGPEHSRSGTRGTARGPV